MQKVPVIINSRNRLSCLKLLVEWVQRDSTAQIIILDNDSTYQPLLDYYKQLDHRVVYLGNNLGHTALYTWGGHHNLKSKYFIYTDPDLLPKRDCPKDLIGYLLYLKKKYFTFNKVGAMLETSDIPEHYKFKKDVLNYHKHYCHTKLNECYISFVDTTFAMYDIDMTAGSTHYIRNCLITDKPYTVRHLPWYSDSNNLSEEETYYIKTADAKFINDENNKTAVGLWTQKLRNQINW